MMHGQKNIKLHLFSVITSRQCTYNELFRRIGVTIDAVEQQ